MCVAEPTLIEGGGRFVRGLGVLRTSAVVIPLRAGRGARRPPRRPLGCPPRPTGYRRRAPYSGTGSAGHYLPPRSPTRVARRRPPPARGAVRASVPRSQADPPRRQALTRAPDQKIPGQRAQQDVRVHRAHQDVRGRQAHQHVWCQRPCRQGRGRQPDRKVRGRQPDRHSRGRPQHQKAWRVRRPSARARGSPQHFSGRSSTAAAR